MAKTLLKLFLAALAIRWAYCIGIYLAMGSDGLMGVDSSSYVSAGTIMAQQIADGSLHGWQWFGPNPFMMPIHAWLVGIAALLAGQHAVLCDVLVQGVIDAGTCILVYGMAHTLDPRFATAAGIASAINPTQIVIAGMVYPDTPFVFFVALILLGALRWLKTPSWRWALTIAAGLAFAAWSRVLVAPFAPVLFVLLIAALVLKRRLERRHLAQLGAALAIFVLSVVPISMRNADEYGSWSLTPQGGMHLARWVVPLIWEARDGTPWERGYLEMERRAEAVPHPAGENSFEQSQRYTKVATEELWRLGPLPIAKGWLIGSALNLGTPAIILSPPVSHLPRTGFYETHGRTVFEKIVNFMFRSDNALYAWILLAGAAALLLIRLVQFAGLGAMLTRGHWAEGAILAVWCLFILGVNGPVASPKYRLPMEPALAVFTGAGWALLRRRKAEP